MLTGESRPVQKDVESKIYGGSILNQGNIIIKVTRTSENSSLNQIIKLVENAQNSRAPIQGLADRISRIFVPIVVLLTLITWGIWFTHTYTQVESEALNLGGMSKFHFAFSFGISTLVIACPCALGLATPTAVMVGTGVAASYGILIKGGDVLEKISSITTIVFDKTGTLTHGTPIVKEIISVHEAFKL
jgi:P-type Cu+ transporter